MPKKGGKDKKMSKDKVKKIVEDKTFGMKNKKKSKKVQQYVQQVQQQVKYAGRDARAVRREEEAARAARAAKKAAKAGDELADLFKPVVAKKTVKQTAIAKGADPKSLVCAFFKAGNCVRGKKCKFSHDLSKERKSAKINVYQDPRELDTMDKWDQSKLEEVVAEKSNANKNNETQIICKYFIDAIENRKYGWFWKCPNGTTCKYRHALPPGYVLKTKEDKAKEKEKSDDGPSLEEQIEEERAKLDLSKCHKVTPESFMAWKEKKRKEKKEAVEQKLKAATKKSGGKGLNALTGRDLFMYDPSLFVDDDDADDYVQFEQDDNTKKNSSSSNNNNRDDDDDDEKSASDDDNTVPIMKDHGNAHVVANVADASLFLDDDVDLPDDDDDDDDEDD